MPNRPRRELGRRGVVQEPEDSSCSWFAYSRCDGQRTVCRAAPAPRGEKLLIDCSGQRLGIVDPHRRDLRTELFVATLGASIDTYAKSPSPTSSERHRAYATSGVALGFTNEPVQQLPRSLSTAAGKAGRGKRLFHDFRLSSDHTIACARCHTLPTGGVDGKRGLSRASALSGGD
ncbi:cytochrome c peroxidase [Paraburkholderia youngii]|uniref:cytochrome c peroxidase n=1 Tax=Paraburkholderia youngii TaxID=2782701 RepID=UPI003D1FF8F4